MLAYARPLGADAHTRVHILHGKERSFVSDPPQLKENAHNSAVRSDNSTLSNGVKTNVVAERLSLSVSDSDTLSHT